MQIFSSPTVQHCPTSLSDKSCYDEDCLSVHIVGTKRHKPKERDSYKRDISGNRTSNDQRNRGNNNSKRTRSSSQSHTKPTPQHENKDFLKIRSFLTNFQTTFQKEIENIKSSIVTQENRIASFFPSANQHIIRHGSSLTVLQARTSCSNTLSPSSNRRIVFLLPQRTGRTF